jgi:hypothetical protein
MYPAPPVTSTTFPLAPASTAAAISLTSDSLSLYCAGACGSAAGPGDDRTEGGERREESVSASEDGEEI